MRGLAELIADLPERRRKLIEDRVSALVGEYQECLCNCYRHNTELMKKLRGCDENTGE